MSMLSEQAGIEPRPEQRAEFSVDFLLMITLSSYQFLGHKLTPEMKAFLWWFMTRYPHFMTRYPHLIKEDDPHRNAMAIASAITQSSFAIPTAVMMLSSENTMSSSTIWVMIRAKLVPMPSADPRLTRDLQCARGSRGFRCKPGIVRR